MRIFMLCISSFRYGLEAEECVEIFGWYYVLFLRVISRLAAHRDSVLWGLYLIPQPREF